MKNLSSKIKSLIRIILSLLIIFSASVYIGNKQNTYHSWEGATTKAFYSEEKDSLDYVVIGSSAAMFAISPLEIYRDTKLKGYNLSMEALISDVYCSMLCEAIERQKNAVIIVDIDGFLQEDSSYEDKTSAFFWISSMNHNVNFLRTIIELDKENAAEYLFPVSKYHKNLTSNGYLKSVLSHNENNFYLDSKGFDNRQDDLYRFNEYNPEKITVYSINTDETVELENVSNYYLHHFLDICKTKGLDNVIFVRFPKSGMTEEDYNKQFDKAKNSNYIKQEVESYGYKMLDYLSMGNPASIKVEEFLDKAHLHIDGAIKFSHFLEDYLVEVLGTDHLPDDEWDYLSNNIDDMYNKIRY